MQTPRECFFETLKPDGKPDRLLKQFEAFAFLRSNPVVDYIRGARYRGMPPTKDKFGTVMVWPEEHIAAMSHVTEDNKVIPDVTTWHDVVKIPDVIANCSAQELWEPVLESMREVDRTQLLVMPYIPTGVFERLHFLMGFEDTLANLLLEPEAMLELCEAIGEYRYNVVKLIVDSLHPDAFLSHDDWGSKRSLFMKPETWREFIKPQYEKQYGYLHDNGVVILHHSDSFCEPIVQDMIDLHIDIWQGALPENDIVSIQKKFGGRITLMGGLDMSIIDRDTATEEEIRAEVRRACETYGPQGHFIPSVTYGGPGAFSARADELINDEIDRYNKRTYSA